MTIRRLHLATQSPFHPEPGGVPALSLEPGTHDRFAVAATSAAARSRGAFVAQTRLRPLDGGEIQIVQTFGATEDAARDTLRKAVAGSIGTVTQPAAPLGEPLAARASDADTVIINSREAMRKFAALIYRSHRFIAPDSDAANDARLSGSDIVPVNVVDGFVSAIVDHLQAWVDKTGGHEGEPQLWLSLYSDYTLFRPVLESLAAAIWVLGPDDSRERIKNATKLLATELSQSKRFADRVRRAGHPDALTDQVNAGPEHIVHDVCIRMGFDERQINRPVDPSTLPDKASRFIPGGNNAFYRLWSICSAHAHAQLFAVMRHGARTAGSGPHGGWTYVEADSESFAELIKFAGDGLNVLSTLLNRRGHSLDAESGPRPGGSTEAI